MSRSTAILPILAACLLAAAATAAAAAPSGPATDVGGAIAGDTTWTVDGSPYVTTGDVQVQAGATLTIEPGVTVRMGAYHNLVVSGRLQAVGTAERKIVFEAAASQPWGAVQLAAGSGPSELAFVDLTGGGARQREMLGIATDQALVRDARLANGKGIGLEIKGGASPTVRDSFFYQASGSAGNPPAALRIVGASRAVVTGNFFQSNIEAVSWDPNASPVFTGNRFDRNGVNGVRVTGKITQAVVWPSLGPRAWAYHIHGAELEIAAGGRLDIGPGATVRLGNGSMVRVRGTFVAGGTAGGKILFSDDIPADRPHRPGAWREVRFEPESVDHDPATGEGSRVEHAVFEYGGASVTGALFVLDASPRIANTAVRQSGARAIGVRGSEARPSLVAVELSGNTAKDGGIGLDVSEGAAPDVPFAVIRGNYIGVHAASGSRPRLGPHTRFEGNETYAVVVADPDVCVDATGNDWSGAGGPLDQSAETDACGQGDYAGNGELITDNVSFEPYEGRLPEPFIDLPRCGTTRTTTPSISGYSPPGSDAVIVYDNQVEIGRAAVTASGGGPPTFTFTPPDLAPGSHVIQAQSARGDERGRLSTPLPLMVDLDQAIDPSAITASYDLDGNHYVQRYLNDDGCSSVRDDNGWTVRPLTGPAVTLAAPIACRGGETPVAEVEYQGVRHPMSAGPDGRLGATVAQGAGGPFAFHVRCGAVEQTARIGTINPAVDSFVFDASVGVLKRVQGARVTLQVKPPGTTEFGPWNAEDYFGQSNPQITGPAGWFAFYPPPGTYRLAIDAQGFEPFVSAEVTVNTEPVFLQAGLRPTGRVYLPGLQIGE